MGEQNYGLDPEIVSRLAAGDQGASTPWACRLRWWSAAATSSAASPARRAAWSARPADYMGMLATVINSLAMQSALERLGVPTRVQSAIIDAVGVRALYPPPRHPPHGEGPGGDLRRRHRQPVLHHRHRGGAARLRTECEALLKATKVDGVYSADPKKDPQRRRYERLSYLEVLSRDLKVMDAAAISLARENRIPILVFSIHNHGGFADVVTGRGRFTIITEESGAMNEDPLVKDLRRRMDGAVEVLRKEFAGLRTGRASASLLEPVMVEAYGNPHAAEPGRHRQRAGAAPHRGPGLGPRRRQGGRQGDPRGRARPQSADRGPDRSACRSPTSPRSGGAS